jgi:HEAT repeat protein
MIRQLVRPHGDRLVALFPKAEEAGPRELARLCLLAGYSGDERLAAPLKPRLDHPDDAVRDAAAIGLGFLGQGDGRARLESIVARPEPSDAAAKAEANRRKTDAKRALHVLGN